MTDVQYPEIEVKKIMPSELNYRKVFKRMNELTDSVKAKGVLQPILVRPKLNPDDVNISYEIVAGHRRYSAVVAAGLDTVPAIIKELSDEEALELQIVENSQREDPNPMEEAEGFKRLLDMGKHTTETLALKIDRSTKYVLQRLKLIGLAKVVKDKIVSGEVTLGVALLLTRLKNAKEQEELLKEVLEEDLTINQIKHDLAAYTLRLENAVFDKKDCETCAYRSRNQTVLFPELEKTDECTDRNCFFAKTQKQYDAIVKEKAALGFKIITDKGEAEKLTAPNAKTSSGIVPLKKEASYQTPYPRKYKGQCMKCTEHHAWYIYKDENWKGNKRIEFGEICLNVACLDEMNNLGKAGQAAEAEAESESGPDAQSLRTKAHECRDRWLQRVLPARIEVAPVMQKRLLLYRSVVTIANGARTDGSKDFLDELNGWQGSAGCYYGYTEIYARVRALPEEKLMEMLTPALLLTLPAEDHDVLMMMTHEAGIDINKEVVMDEAFLKGKTKNELTDLIKELSLEIEVKATAKKGEFVKAILGSELAGKMPTPLAQACSVKVKGG